MGQKTLFCMKQISVAIPFVGLTKLLIGIALESVLCLCLLCSNTSHLYSFLRLQDTKFKNVAAKFLDKNKMNNVQIVYLNKRIQPDTSAEEVKEVCMHCSITFNYQF